MGTEDSSSGIIAAAAANICSLEWVGKGEREEVVCVVCIAIMGTEDSPSGIIAAAAANICFFCNASSLLLANRLFRDLFNLFASSLHPNIN